MTHRKSSDAEASTTSAKLLKQTVNGGRRVIFSKCLTARDVQ